jgi:hypothetical protein
MNFDRALIVRKEWLDLILDGGKTWELRSRHTNVRGAIGLIEAGSGLVVGRANLTDSICLLSIEEWRGGVSQHKVPYRNCEHLAEKWNHAWVLEDAERFDTPIPYQHPKGAVIWVRF